MKANFTLSPMVLMATLLLSSLGSLAADAPPDTSSHGDYFLRYYTSFLQWIDGQDLDVLWSFTRAGAMLVLCTVVCGAALYSLNERLPRPILLMVLWILLFAVSVLSLEIPVPQTPLRPGLKGFLFVASLIAIAILPWSLSFMLVPTERLRRVLSGIVYVGLILVFFFHP
jgi:hypothetical protein